jgi:hypothetical protein
MAAYSAFLTNSTSCLSDYLRGSALCTLRTCRKASACVVQPAVSVFAASLVSRICA